MDNKILLTELRAALLKQAHDLQEQRAAVLQQAAAFAKEIERLELLTNAIESAQ